MTPQAGRFGAEKLAPDSEFSFPSLTFRDPVSVKPHPAYADILDAGTVDVLGDDEIALPIVITKCGTLIAGHDRWQQAVRGRDRVVLCLEYDLTEEAALRLSIRLHATPAILNDYCRIRLALELEAHCRTSAIAPTGSGERLTSKLTTRDRSDVRREIARIAGVSTGNVTKVKQLRKAVIPELDKALRDGALSIHQAWQLSQLPQDQQLTAFLDRRHKRVIDRTIQKLTHQHVRDRAKRLGNEDAVTPSDVLTSLANSDTLFSMFIVPVPCPMVAISQALYDGVRRERAP